MDSKLLAVEETILEKLKGKFTTIVDPAKRKELVTSIAKTISSDLSEGEIDQIFKDMNDLGVVAKLAANEDVEDIMINNTSGIFVYSSREGRRKVSDTIGDRYELNRFVEKLKLYATNETAKGNILDVHMPNGSRANIIASPLGHNITIRNFKSNPLSVLDLINKHEMTYEIAARLWLYVDGLKVRPANLLIGGMPAAGKTTLLNSLFSFFRPEQRVVTIEETYELDSRTQENTARLETSEDMPMEYLVKNALRMRPDLLIIGEVRGEEANDMLTAMNIGKNAMGTIHASTTRDIINRLQHTPMDVPMDIIPAIDALVAVSVVYVGGVPQRKITQISEISGIETQVLLSDLYKYDYKTQQGSQILPSVTYRDTLAKALGIPPADILEEERLRALILERLNELGTRDIKSISESVRNYYDNPEGELDRLGIKARGPIIRT